MSPIFADTPGQLAQLELEDRKRRDAALAASLAGASQSSQGLYRNKLIEQENANEKEYRANQIEAGKAERAAREATENEMGAVRSIIGVAENGGVSSADIRAAGANFKTEAAKAALEAAAQAVGAREAQTKKVGESYAGALNQALQPEIDAVTEAEKRVKGQKQAKTEGGWLGKTLAKGRDVVGAVTPIDTTGEMEAQAATARQNLNIRALDLAGTNKELSPFVQFDPSSGSFRWIGPGSGGGEEAGPAPTPPVGMEPNQPQVPQGPPPRSGMGPQPEFGHSFMPEGGARRETMPSFPGRESAPRAAMPAPPQMSDPRNFEMLRTDEPPALAPAAGVPGIQTDGQSLYGPGGDRYVTWTDANGRKVPASFVDASGRNIPLKDEDMKSIAAYAKQLMQAKGLGYSEAMQAAIQNFMRSAVEPSTPAFPLDQLEPIAGP